MDEATLRVVYRCRVADKTLIVARPEFRLLEEFMSGLGELLDLREGEVFLR